MASISSRNPTEQAARDVPLNLSANARRVNLSSPYEIAAFFHLINVSRQLGLRELFA
jgi:hypothetical protein